MPVGICGHDASWENIKLVHQPESSRGYMRKGSVARVSDSRTASLPYGLEGGDREPPIHLRHIFIVAPPDLTATLVTADGRDPELCSPLRYSPPCSSTSSPSPLPAPHVTNGNQPADPKKGFTDPMQLVRTTQLNVRSLACFAFELSLAIFFLP